MNYDLSPTAPLHGIHMRGTVVRRFLISYPVPPATLTPFLPPGAELCTHGGLGWVSACFVHMEDMRPSLLPRRLGVRFNYLIHRTLARLPFPDGELRPAVLILEPNIDRRGLGVLGALTTGVRFRIRRIQLDETGVQWRLRMLSGSESLYDVVIPTASCGRSLPANSRFANSAAADQMLLGISYGGQWCPERSQLRLLPETHDPWETYTCACVTNKHAFLEALGIRDVQADHAITMTGIPHYFGLRPLDVDLAERKLPGASH